MNTLYEYTDTLNSPIEAFIMDNRDKSFPVESHWHYFVEVLYMIEGTVSVICNESTYLLSHGEMIFLPPQAIHAIYSTTSQFAKYVVLKFDANRINFSADYIPSLSDFFRSPKFERTLPIIFSQKDLTDFQLDHFFLTCVNEMETKQYGYDSYLHHLLSLFMLQLLRCWRALGYEQAVDSYEKQSQSIHNILKYIDSHSHENLKVTELAEMCHMSYSYFARTFHELYGRSCKEYIEFIRLCKVENLLLFTDYDLSFISNETGFADCSHLIRSFKKQYHITPKQYRLSHNVNEAK